MARGAVTDGQPRRDKGKRAATSKRTRGALEIALRYNYLEKTVSQRSRPSVSGGTPPERGGCVPKDTLLGPGFPFSTKIQATHDLEQTGVVGQSKLLGGSGHMPLIALQRGSNDLSFGLGAQSLEGSAS